MFDLEFVPEGKDPQDTSDCWARALSRVLGFPVPEVNKGIKRAEGKPHFMPCRFVMAGVPFTFFKASSLKGTPDRSLLVRDIPEVLPNFGAFVMEIDHHVFAYVDGTVFDLIHPMDEEDFLDEAVLGWWDTTPPVSQTHGWLSGAACCAGFNKLFMTTQVPRRTEMSNKTNELRKRELAARVASLTVSEADQTDARRKALVAAVRSNQDVTGFIKLTEMTLQAAGIRPNFRGGHRGH